MFHYPEDIMYLRLSRGLFFRVGLLFFFTTAFAIPSGETGRPPRILEHPADSVVPRNEPATLNCKADGDPTPTITWLKDGKSIRPDARRLLSMLPSGSLFFLRVRKDQDAGVYACVAENTFGEVTSRNGTLDVATLRDEFRASPQNTWVAQGDTAVLECEPPRGNPEPKVLWKRNGHPIDVKANGRYRILGLGSLSISQVRQSDEGRYVCTAKNIVGMRQSNVALLRVTVRPQFTIVPANTSALLGSDVSLACVARGDPPPEITWKKQRGTLPLKRAHFDEERFLISNVSEQDAGIYTCVAENKAGSIASSASVTVLALPAFSVIPQNVEIQPNSTAYFGCETVGEPKPTLFWSREGSHSVIFQGSALENARVTPEGTLQIDNVSERDEGYYFCAAVSPAGSVMSRVHLKVTPVEDLPPPIINVGPSNQTRPVGSVAVMPCIADGNPPPVITWYKNSNSFMLNHRIFTDDAGTLRINDLSREDSGLYECVASSRSGKYVWRAYLQVESPTNPNVNFRRTGFDMGNLRPKGPMKPHIVKVDSTSVTIAWHPKYFQFFEPETSESEGDSNRFLVENDHHESGSSGSSSNSHNTGSSSSSNIRSELNRNSHNGQEGRSSSFVQESINIKKVKETKSFLDESDEEEDDDEEDDDIMLDDQPMPFLPEWSADKESQSGSDNEDDTRNDFLEQSDTLPNSRQKEWTDSSFLRNHRDRSISFSLSPSTTHSPLTRPRLILSRRRRQQPSSSSSFVQKENKDKDNRYEQKPSNDASSSFLNEPVRSRNVFNVDDANVESDEGGFAGGFEDEDEYREEKQSFDDVIDQITKQERERENEEFGVDEEVNVETHSNVNANNNLIIQSTKSNSRISSSTTNAPLTTTPSISPELFKTSTATTTSPTFASALTSPRASAPVNVLSKTNTNDVINVKSANTQNSLTYKVEYYSNAEERSEWLLGATNVPLEVFTLQYLKPNTEYIFFVRSVSQEGIVSAPSPLSSSVTTLMSGSRNSDLNMAREKFGSGIVVLLKNAYATSSTSSRIEWQVVNAGDFIEGFYIYFRQMGQKDEGSYQMLTVLNAGASTFQIVGLEKYTTYQIFLLPFYKNVDGRPSNYVNVTTLQDVPTAAPELLDPIPVNSSALIVHWKPPPVRHQNGVIMGYQLRVWSGSALVGNRTVNGSTVSLLLNNLTPGKSYSLQIGSFTAKGVGVFSSMKTLHFRPENPSPDNNSIDNNNKMSNSVHSQPSDNNYKGKVGNGGSKSAGNNNKSNKINGKTYDGNNINFGSGSLGVSQGGNGIRGNGDGSDEEYDGLSTATKNDGVAYGGTVAHHDFFTEAWFVALIGSVIFVMMAVFVFALYMRRCQLRKDGDKLKVSTTEIPDGSIPPHYQEDNLWIDSQQKQLSLKSVKTNDLNEYENANNYAVVEDRHSPIPYATTTLINGEKHKSNFSVFGESTKAMNGHGGSRPGDFGMMASPKMVGWASAAVPQNNKTGSLNICSQDMKKLPWLSTTPAAPSTPCPSQSHSKVNLKPKLKLKSKGKERLRSKRENFGGGNHSDDDDDVTESFCLNSQDLGKGASLNVLTTFQTPLPSRKHLIVDFSNGQSVTSSILQYHEPRLIVGSNGSGSTASTTVNSSNHNNYSHSHNSHNGYAHSHSHNHNGHNVNHNAF